MPAFDYIRHRLDEVCGRLCAAAARAGRPVPRLVAVTKSATDEEVLALCACGVADLAENRAGCFTARRDLLAAHGFAPRLHLIGSLQTNKVKYIIRDAALVQSLDSLRLAEELEKRAAAAGRVLPVLCEVNCAEEEQKGGISPRGAEAFCEAVAGPAFSHLSLCGLMTMGPPTTGEALRPYFRETRRLFDRLAGQGLFCQEPILSMGMSDSYEVAAEEGATMVRVGRQLFQKDN